MRLLACVSAVFVAGALLPSIANATDLCVAPNATCDQAHTYPSVETALAKADDAPDADRILLGDEHYVAPTTAGYTYDAASSPVEIVGVGLGETVLSAPTGAHTILELVGGPGSVVRNLTIHAPANVGGGSTLLTLGNTARHIEITEENQQSGWHWGAYLEHGAVLEDSSVELGATQDSTGVFLTEGGTLRHSNISAVTPVQSNTGTIERSALHGETAGIYAYDGDTTVTASTIDVNDGYGILLRPYTGVPVSSVTADGITIFRTDGNGNPGDAGAFVDSTGGTGESAAITLRNSLIRRFPIALKALAGTGVAKVATSYSDYNASGNFKSGANAVIEQTRVSNMGDAGFVNAAGGDYHLLPSSPLVDAGDPATAQGFDLDGRALVTDGNGDGIARRDIGAYESPAPPAKPPAGPPPDTAAPVVSGLRAAHMRVRFRLSETARVTLRLQRKRTRHGSHRFRTIATVFRQDAAGPNRIRLSRRIHRRALRPGTYRVVVTATDAAGNRSARRTARLRVLRR